MYGISSETNSGLLGSNFLSFFVGGGAHNDSVTFFWLKFDPIVVVTSTGGAGRVVLKM